MSTDSHNSSLTQIREIINRLQLPVPDLSTLVSLLSAPLESLNLLPPRFKPYNISPLLRGAVNISRHVPALQRALLQHVVPTWETTLREENASLLLQYFCPDSFCFTSPAAGEVTLLAYSNILSLPLSEYSIGLLARLTKEYPVDRLHSAVFRTGDVSRTSITWQDCVRDVAAVPAKVANAMEGKAEIPDLLEHATYFNNISQRCEALIFSLSSANSSKDKVSSITYLLTKLVNLGVFPAAPPTSRSQPSFFLSTLPRIRARLKAEYRHIYASYWSEVIQSLPSTFTLQAIVTSLFFSLSELSSGIDASPHQRALVKRGASLLLQIVGPLRIETQELWDCVLALILGQHWGEGHGRILACWVAGADKDAVDEEGLEVLLAKVVDIWSSTDHIKHSLISRHHHLTSLLLVTVSYFRPNSTQLNALAFSPSFISGVGTYVGHLDNSVRHCGMLVAEIVAQRAGKKLDFGDWEGDDAGKPWARKIRQLITARDIDVDIEAGIEITDTQGRDTDGICAQSASKDTDSAEPTRSQPIVLETGYDSDDSLTGYASPTSSRSSSPTPSELDEIEKDPTLRVGIKKIYRPVYLTQLGEMVRSTGGLNVNDDNQADKIEMALDCAEELIRKKRDYGTELEENAVNLVYGLVGLQDNFDLKDFEIKRQGAVNALVACCPRKTAPCVIEEFFKNQYSTSQRYLMLNALALGARELASLFVPPAINPISSDRISFPSKILPTKRHQQYLAAGNQDHIIRRLLDGITRDAIERSKDATADKVPQLVRERQLRIRKPTKITELNQETVPSSLPVKTTFTTLGAEFFIMPLINRFWLFLRDEQMREERTAHHDTLHQYRGAGTGLILNSVVLAHFLGTLAVLVHAAQNAPEWLAVVAPDALELALTLGTRPVSQMDIEDDQDDTTHGPAGREASVLTTALELALVVLDGCLELDGGRVLGLEHTAVLLGVGEWAGSVFGNLEKGVRAVGEGGAQEVKLTRAAAGVLLKVDELTSKWRRSMVDIG